MKRIFSGVQPSGNLHLGNYLGAIKRWVSLQDTYDPLFCIVDLHAITVPQDPALLKQKIREVAALYLAAGIDPKKSTIFVQSCVPAHAELAWILNCFLPMGWLERMTQFKEKAGPAKERVSVGLFAYPALMAADILLYETDLVPTGEDQRQHIELARDLAARINQRLGHELFRLPEALIGSSGARIMGLDDPTKKMSKSVDRPHHALGLLDPPEAIREKIARATTDSGNEIVFDPNRPGITNLLVIYELLSGTDRPVIEAHFAGKTYATLKSDVADAVIENLKPLQERFAAIMKDQAALEQILDAGAAKAAALAEPTLAQAKTALGLS